MSETNNSSTILQKITDLRTGLTKLLSDLNRLEPKKVITLEDVEDLKRSLGTLEENLKNIKTSIGNYILKELRKNNRLSQESGEKGLSDKQILTFAARFNNQIAAHISHKSNVPEKYFKAPVRKFQDFIAILREFMVKLANEDKDLIEAALAKAKRNVKNLFSTALKSFVAAEKLQKKAVNATVKTELENVKKRIGAIREEVNAAPPEPAAYTEANPIAVAANNIGAKKMSLLADLLNQGRRLNTSQINSANETAYESYVAAIDSNPKGSNERAEALNKITANNNKLDRLIQALQYQPGPSEGVTGPGA
jgi:hypothetical protein